MLRQAVIHILFYCSFSVSRYYPNTMPSTRNATGPSDVEKQILEQLAGLSENQVTKRHFDDEITGIKSTLQKHEDRFNAMEDRLAAVESTTSNPDMIYKELYDQECRKSNIVVLNFPEQNNHQNKREYYIQEHKQVKEMFTDMEIIDSVNDTIKMRLYRLGKTPNNDKPRPLKIIFRNNEIKNEVFSAVKHLKGNPKWRKVNICCDLTKKQLALGKEKRAALLLEAQTKNDERTADDIDKGIEWKVYGNYGRCNLRLQKVQPPIPINE